MFSAFQHVSVHQLPPQRRITQEEAPSMMGLSQTQAQAQCHAHAQAQVSKPGSAASFAGLSAGRYAGSQGSGPLGSSRKKARLG